ncbi:hypothetical protein F0562_009765 [Nyssa sinensis]|uniref:Uncharacterized protein n=1 Tax=Nyssa sinensis TaxID=561372 RepID=A0A5J5A0T4_9ASTE|nr:hypothetical protein F0562_009765 [Nyssa sinensis]
MLASADSFPNNCSENRASWSINFKSADKDIDLARDPEIGGYNLNKDERSLLWIEGLNNSLLFSFLSSAQPFLFGDGRKPRFSPPYFHLRGPLLQLSPEGGATLKRVSKGENSSELVDKSVDLVAPIDSTSSFLGGKENNNLTILTGKQDFRRKKLSKTSRSKCANCSASWFCKHELFSEERKQYEFDDSLRKSKLVTMARENGLRMIVGLHILGLVANNGCQGCGLAA